MQTVPYLIDNPEVGYVQARWTFANPDESYLTKVLSVLLAPYVPARQEHEQEQEHETHALVCRLRRSPLTTTANASSWCTLREEGSSTSMALPVRLQPHSSSHDTVAAEQSSLCQTLCRLQKLKTTLIHSCAGQVSGGERPLSPWVAGSPGPLWRTWTCLCAPS